MSTPAISVVIPSYNPKKYIKQCVKSILDQSMKDIEVIIVDDGSTDRKWIKVIEGLGKKDRRLRLIRNVHQGLALTRKEGFLQSKSEYIFFMDCDDFLPKNALKNLYDAATNTGADITIGNFVRVADSYGLFRIYVPQEYETSGKLIPKENILRECYYSLIDSIDDPIKMLVWGRLYKNSLIRQALKESDKDPFVSDLLEDWWFNLILMPYINSINLTKDIVYYYRYGGTSTTIAFKKGIGTSFFNYRFDQFEKWNFQEGHSRTYACFSAVLYDSLKYLILSESYSQDEILAFLRKQTSNKIVDWARNNMVQIESLPQYYKQFATEEPEIIYCWLSNALHSKRAKRHRALKKCVLACSKVLDVIYQTLH